jgi:carbamoyl-phosphate synthase large subunit
MNDTRRLTVLISSVGRRSQLIGCFRRTLSELGVEGRVLGMDANPSMSPAAHLVDACFPVSRCTAPGFVDEVLALCAQQQVDLIVPTIDTELPAYAASRARLAEQGVDAALSAAETVEIACDKVRTHAFLVDHGISTVRQADGNAVLSQLEQWPFPLMVKPRRGSASIGVLKVHSEAMLRAALRSDPELIVQEYAQGFECTVNVFVDAAGKCICAVPHRRIEVRGGEVSKAVTLRNPRVIALARRLTEALPGAYGPLNIQCFVSGDTVVVIEINARFGGGYPLAFEAGANFPLWLLRSRLHQDIPAWFDGWKDNLTMLRYDAAIFF